MNYDLLAAGLLLGGSSVALALTALAARRARIDRRRAEFAAKHTRIDMTTAASCCAAAKEHAGRSMKAANAASLDRLFTTTGITVTPPEATDVIPIPRPPLKIYTEIADTPGSVGYGADPGDVIEFPEFWREFGEAGA